MEVRHINRSSSATRHPKVYTGAKSEFESVIMRRVVRPYYSNRTATVQQPRCGSIWALISGIVTRGASSQAGAGPSSCVRGTADDRP